MPQIVKKGIFQSLSAVHGLMALILDLLTALSLLGAGLMFVVGISVGGGEWKLSLFPLSAALVFQMTSRLYDLALRKLNPADAAIAPAAAGMAN